MGRTGLRDALLGVVGPAGLLEGDAIGAAFHEDIGHERTGRPWLVLRPADTAQVSRCLRLLHEAGQPTVPQGGMTGLVSAGTPADGEVVLSLRRMTAIEEIDGASATLIAQAGTPLQSVQEAADAAGFFYPLDIGSRGSCTVGGNLATNAGGNRVLRYGMARDLVLGLEAVLADGTVLDGMHKMTKNNAGYDLKQLFIGSEGTLGVITRAVLKLHPRPASQAVAFCALPDFGAALSLLGFLRGALGGRLSAFEALWANAYALIIDKVPRVRPPLPPGRPFYLLVESLGADPESDSAAFERSLGQAIERGLVEDAVVATSQREIQELWAVRDAVSEAVLALDPFLSYDVSMPQSSMDDFGRAVIGAIATQFPSARTGVFGHIGDGNIHIVTDGGGRDTPRHRVDSIVYDATRAVRGSVSAEHGIGFQKRQWLGNTRTPQEIAVMRQLKHCLDPKGILSPGRIFPADS
ncbi:MAG: FAD-binding oxidoreductase [Lautropia sp.]